jgi:hypothetical protein
LWLSCRVVVVNDTVIILTNTDSDSFVVQDYSILRSVLRRSIEGNNPLKHEITLLREFIERVISEQYRISATKLLMA